MARADVNPDFRDLLRALCDARAEFLVVGGYAVMFFTAPRYTKDLDVWVRPTRDNAERVLRALRKFGAPGFAVNVEQLVDPQTIFQMGVPPNRIDLVTDLDGLAFERAWRNRARTSYGGVRIGVLGLSELMRNKRAVGRPQDLLDLENLERAARARKARRRRAAGKSRAQTRRER